MTEPDPDLGLGPEIERVGRDAFEDALEYLAGLTGARWPGDAAIAVGREWIARADAARVGRPG